MEVPEEGKSVPTDPEALTIFTGNTPVLQSHHLERAAYAPASQTGSREEEKTIILGFVAINLV